MAKFSFIDLYAGIGGIRYAFETAKGYCVFSSEWDENSKKTYKAFHGHAPDVGDITKVVEILADKPDAIPAHNILTAGFPCQPFSLAGVSKKQSLGRRHGFDDPRHRKRPLEPAWFTQMRIRMPGTALN